MARRRRRVAAAGAYGGAPGPTSNWPMPAAAASGPPPGWPLPANATAMTPRARRSPFVLNEHGQHVLDEAFERFMATVGLSLLPPPPPLRGGVLPFVPPTGAAGLPAAPTAGRPGTLALNAPAPVAAGRRRAAARELALPARAARPAVPRRRADHQRARAARPDGGVGVGSSKFVFTKR